MPPTSASRRASRVAVVTVNYNSEDVLPTLLDSVAVATEYPVEVVVADNRPTERSREIAASHDARRVELPENPGYGAAVNAAVATLGREVEWILVVNPDVELGDRAIDRLVDVGDGDPSIGSVGPAVRTPEGDIYPSARRIPGLRVGIGHALFFHVWPANPWSKLYREESSPYRRDAGWLSGSCVLVRRSAFDELGGFDPSYFMYFEDVDLGYRLGRAGYRNVYEPGADAMHVGATSTQGDSAAMLDAHHRSAQRFMVNKYPGPILWPIRVAVTIGLGIRRRIVRRAASR